MSTETLTHSVPLLDLKAEFASVREEVLAGIDKVLESGWFYLGPETQALEKEWAAYCGTTYGIGLGSGTEALWLALLAAGVGQGDEVITVSHTFIATAASIHFAGARPVFVDIDPVTYNMDVAQVEAAITPRTRALLPVHLYGQPADMAPLMELAKRHGLWVIEDACQAHGAEYQRNGGPVRRAGGLGHIAATSFVFTKNLKAYGDAGAITTDNPEVDQFVRAFRDHGRSGKYEHPTFGMNCRIDEIQAAVVRAKLPCLEGWIAARRRNAAALNEGLAGLEWLQTPAEMDGVRHVYHQYVVQTSYRDALADHLKQRGISTGVHYPIPCHLQRACSHLGYEAGSLPHTERAAAEILSLPAYPELTEGQVAQIVEAVRSFSPTRSAA
jgi:dTDP-4-amino-4,6-dideoxygalactose transaminase